MTKKNPWQTLSSRVVYQNPWISVREDQVIRPDGKAGIYGVVDCRVATGVIAINESGEICLVGQYRYATDQYSWEIIEGGAELNESPQVAAMRELKEEAGIIAKTWRPLGGEIHLTNCHSSERGYLFLATDLSTVAAEPEGTEVLELRWVTPEIAKEMIVRGEISDALTVIALSRIDSVTPGRIVT